MKYFIVFAFLSISLFSVEKSQSKFEIANSFQDVIIHNTFIVGENGDFQSLSEALESDLVKDSDQILINTKTIDEGEIIVTKNVIIKSANHLKDQVVIIGKVTVENAHVVIDNLTIDNLAYDFGEAIFVNNGSLTVYEHLELLGAASAENSEINNFGKLIVTE